MVERQFNKKTRRVRLDNAWELGKGTQKSKFFQEQGIIHETSCVAIPQQNKIVEKKHRHLLEIAIGLLFQSNIPLQYWGEYVLTAIFLINKFPSKLLKGKTPYAILFGKELAYEVLTSYAQGQKGYKVMDKYTKIVFVSKDIKFHEDFFPFYSPHSNTYFTSYSNSTNHTHVPAMPPTYTPSSVPSTDSPSHNLLLDSSPHSSISDIASIPVSSPISLRVPRSSLHPETNLTPILEESYTPSYLPVQPISKNVIPTPPPPIRKSDRISQRPTYLKDYVCNAIILSDLTGSCFTRPTAPNVFFFRALSATKQHLVHSLSTIFEPNNYAQASIHPGWKAAM
ncbi:uncharacterized protein LOC142178736 [Nicotiana tabacum]|uniref:Uncharacterized protein LOC142178736 n=1 Tax=Nicotiana tabacum TaxID=4097 RepID=A0AC58U566_TOBAC